MSGLVPFLDLTLQPFIVLFGICFHVFAVIESRRYLDTGGPSWQPRGSWLRNARV